MGIDRLPPTIVDLGQRITRMPTDLFSRHHSTIAADEIGPIALRNPVQSLGWLAASRIPSVSTWQLLTLTTRPPINVGTGKILKTFEPARVTFFSFQSIFCLTILLIEYSLLNGFSSSIMFLICYHRVGIQLEVLFFNSNHIILWYYPNHGYHSE